MTIYRDIQAFCEADVPIVWAPGAGFLLVEGYFLPPISFTTDVAVAQLVREFKDRSSPLF